MAESVFEGWWDEPYSGETPKILFDHRASVLPSRRPSTARQHNALFPMPETGHENFPPGDLKLAPRPSCDAEILIATALLCAVVIIGMITVSDYGITVDEWNADDYGAKALAWYASGDRAMFEAVEETLWYYGPWFHILISLAQSLELAEHWTVRHLLTFLAGVAGIALLIPIGRRAVGRWAGLVAVVLCLTTGYLYGSIFFTPIDVPFLLAMNGAVLAIVMMAGRKVPSWRATIFAGALTGLAIGTRSSGLITHVYLIGAMTLCVLDAFLVEKRPALYRSLGIIGLRTFAAILIAWMTALATWPWLQIGNPIQQFTEAFSYFANHPASWRFMHWGETVTTNHLPWSYIPAQLAARLPEGFIFLLVVAFVAGLAATFRFLAHTMRLASRLDGDRLKESGMVLARSRQILVVWVAALLPMIFVMIKGSTLYDGVRHVLFLIPLLAVLAGYGFLRLGPVLTRYSSVAAAVIGIYVGYQTYVLARLHPLQYVAFNTFAGGVFGAYGRFDMDYWAAAATVALRRLEERIDLETPDRFQRKPPSLLICIAWREAAVTPMYRRPWRIETDPGKSDYIIATERSNCADGQPMMLIDEVKRFRRSFAWTYIRHLQDR